MRRIAYLMSRFPLVSETFILRELEHLDALGWDVSLYPLIVESPNVRHSETDRWMPRVQRIPFFGTATVTGNARMWSRRPKRVASALSGALSGNISSRKFLMRAVALFPKAVAAARRMEREGVAHVHAHYATHPALAAWIVHQLTGIPYSVTVHAHDLYVDRSMLVRKLENAAFVATVSEYNRARIGLHAGPSVEAKTHIVRCGVDPDRYGTAPRRIRDGAEPVELVSVGSLQPYKGQMHLIDACATLRRDGLSFRLRIVGEGADRTQLERRIAEHGLAESVHLLGERTQQEVASILAEADVYIQPSIVESSGKMEGIPVALMEAMASRIPVVATRISGIPELVRDGETGTLVDPMRPQAIAQAIQSIVREPRAFEAITSNARRLIEREYDVRSNSARLAALFERQARTGADGSEPAGSSLPDAPAGTGETCVAGEAERAGS